MNHKRKRPKHSRAGCLLCKPNIRVARAVSGAAVGSPAKNGRDARPAQVDAWSTCSYPFPMSVMVQIRNVPTELHRRLKARAALAGMTLSDYLLHEIRRMAERPSVEELRARLRGRSAAIPSISPARAVRAQRGSR